MYLVPILLCLLTYKAIKTMLIVNFICLYLFQIKFYIKKNMETNIFSYNVNINELKAYLLNSFMFCQNKGVKNSSDTLSD